MGLLGIKLAGIDTSYPSLSVGTHPARILGFEQKESGNNPGLFMLNVKFETIEPAFDTKNKQHDPGFKFNYNLTLPSETVQPEHSEMRVKSLAAFVDAVFNLSEDQIDERPELTQELLDQMVGKVVMVEFKKAKDDKYGETDIKKVTAVGVPADAAA